MQLGTALLELYFQVTAGSDGSCWSQLFTISRTPNPSNALPKTIKNKMEKIFIKHTKFTT